MPEVSRDGVAADLLRDLAKRTAHAPAPPGTGRYHHVHTSGAHLRTNSVLSRTGSLSVANGTVEEFERRQWLAADGSGHVVVTRDGEVVPPSGDHGPSELAALFITATDEASLAGKLAELNPQRTTRSTIRMFQRIWGMQVVPPALQRLLLLELAECAGLSREQAPREFAGRSGVAVTHVDNDRHVRHLLAFDEETGALIGTEVLALEGARVPVPVPAVTSRTEWHYSGYDEHCGPASSKN